MNQDKTIPLDEVSNARLPTAGADGAFSPEDASIRDRFDTFFEYFDKVNAFRSSALVRWEDLSYFEYWYWTISTGRSLCFETRVENVGDDSIHRKRTLK
jgi:hypothetical protein